MMDEPTPGEMAALDQANERWRQTKVVIDFPLFAQVINRHRRLHRLRNIKAPAIIVEREQELLHKALVALDEAAEKHDLPLGDKPESWE